MPPRRRTFYLADATVLSNSKVRRLARQHPDDWLAAWGAFHILIGVATLNGSPRLTDEDVTDTLGADHDRLADVLRDAGLLTRTGIDPATFREWCPKPRPRYPSDSRGITPDSDGVPPDSGGIEHDSARTPTESPTSSTSSSSTSSSKAASSSRGVGPSAAQPLAPKGAAALVEKDLPPFLQVVNET
jgi:hypothetical protein